MEGWRAGVGRADITPLAPVPMAGYPPITVFPDGPQDHVGYTPRVGPSLGVHDQVEARAVVLEQGGRRVALVSVDLCWVGLDFTQRVRQRVAAQWGSSVADVWLCCSHSHSAPDISNQTEPIAPAAVAWIEARIAAAIEDATHHLEPARIGWGHADLSEVVVNRRDASRPVDGSVTVVRVDNEFDAPLAVLINFACHPIILGSNNAFISAEYPGVASRFVEHELGAGCVCLFTQGAAGNINPRSFPYSEGENISAKYKRLALQGQQAPFRSYREAERFGRLLGAKALCAAEAIERFDASGSLGYASRVLDVPLKRGAPLERYFEHLNVSAGYAGSLRGKSHLRTELAAIRMGSHALVAIPCELFVELGLEVKRRWSAWSPVVVAYANDMIGYVPDEDGFGENRYETMATPLTHEAARLVLAATDDVVRAVTEAESVSATARH